MQTRFVEVHKLDSWPQFIESVRTGPIRTHASGGRSYLDQVLYRGNAQPD